MTPEPQIDTKTLNTILARYRRPEVRRSVGQLMVSAVWFLLLWVAALWALRVGFWLTLLIAIPAGAFAVRLFLIQHDCGHASYFRSRRANDLVGSIIGMATMMPYAYWRKTHAIHHKTSGDLDNRNYGDIDTLTVNEYDALPWHRRLAYRAYRNPFVLLVIGPMYQIVLKHRLPLDAPSQWKSEWRSVHYTNLAFLALAALASQTIGLGNFLMVHIPIIVIGGSIGIYLFFVQHQFEDTYWRRHSEWRFEDAALKGSSYLALPRPLQWLLANIGWHHIHHVNSRIPNYLLQSCFDENPELRHATRLTLWQSFRCLSLSLWDEEAEKLVRFSDVRAARAPS